MQTTVEEPAAIYVDSRCGDDRADGATPATAIASLKQLESFTLKPGTRVLFRAGGVWYGSYHPVGSGLPQQPIIITRYGAGPDPILCGTTESSTVSHSISNSVPGTGFPPSTRDITAFSTRPLPTIFVIVCERYSGMP